LLVLFTIAMVLFSLAHVLVGFHLSRGETRYAWIVAGAVLVQIAALAFLPTDVEGVILVNIAVGTALLAAHELFVDSSVPALHAGWRHLQSGIHIPRRIALEALLAIVGATAFVCVLFAPLTVALGSTVVGQGSDATGGIWWLWQLQQESGYHLFGTTHHTLTGAPFGWDGDNGLNIQWLIPYYSAYLATWVVGPVAAQNLILLAGYVLSGASMYVLVRYLGCARLVSAWAGMVFIVFPWHLERTPHPSLVHLEFLPLLLLAMVAATRRPSWSRFLFVGAATVACWLTSGYFGTMAVVAAAAFSVGAILSAARRRPSLVLVGTAASTVGASLFVAFLSVISGVGRGSGLHRIAGDLSVYGLRPLELVVPAAGNLVLGDWTGPFLEDRQHGSGPTETSNYLGLLTIGLALAWLVFAWRARATLDARLRLATPGLVAVVLTALLLAMPSPITVFGREYWMPSRLLWEVVPPFRVPSRWVVLAMAALVPLAALALQEASTRLAKSSGRWRGIQLLPVSLVVGAMLVSFLELSIDPARPRLDTNRVPPEYAALARTPDGVLVEYPLIHNIDHLFWQRFHGRPVLNSEAFGTPADDARRVVLDPGASGTAEALAFLGVTAIVTHRDALRYTEAAPDVPNASWGPGYALVTRTGDGASVWRVVAPPAPALVTLHSGFGEPKPPERGAIDFPLVSPSGVGYFELRAKEPGVVRLTFDAEPPTGAQRVLRIADADSEIPITLVGRTPVSLLVEVPTGLSLLFVKTDPAATSVDDAIDITAPRAKRASGTPDLQAEPISPDVGF
jgi:hypothetical protein